MGNTKREPLEQLEFLSGFDRFQFLIWTTLLINQFNILCFIKELPSENPFNSSFRSCFENSAIFHIFLLSSVKFFRNSFMFFWGTYKYSAHQKFSEFELIKKYLLENVYQFLGDSHVVFFQKFTSFKIFQNQVV